ncbi:class I SAM-dependent methyltransferase [Streptomyces sp. NPDC041068]|uniref:class I SAM-dependent methyltransferase n=1 Tax=Streptomyces sp. NPDC041068 TaxID=3155130 RepID=UPI0033CCB759
MTEGDSRLRGLQSLEFKKRFDSRLAEIDALAGFDTTHGVETGRPIEPWEIPEADDETLRSHSRYSPTPIRTILQAIAAAPVDHQDVSFVDFGSGKGRVLLAAADFPFKRVIGVEFSEYLCGMARANIEKYRASSQRCHDIEVRCEDARDFAIPADAAFFYLYEPFKGDIAGRVFGNIEESLREHPRPVIVCLVGERLLPTVAERTAWQQVGETLVSPDDPYFDARLFTVNQTHVERGMNA